MNSGKMFCFHRSCLHLKREKFNACLFSWLSPESSDIHPRRSSPSNLSTHLVPFFSPTMQLKACILSLTVIAAFALAHPLPRDATLSDADILNFALTLEHVESAFYTRGLSRFKHEDFVHAGFPDWTYGRLEQIAAHEAAHVEFLEKIIGDKAPKPCSYKFSYDDPKSFITLSHALEVIGDSSYIGASKFFVNKENLLAAATILSTESRHSAWLDSALRQGSAWSGPFDTPLDPSQAFTIASSFITSCPSTNPSLPITSYAQLTLPDPAGARPGSTISLQFTPPSSLDHSTPLYGAFMSGQEAFILPLSDGGKSITIPGNLRGVVFLLITTSADSVDDSKIIAGPALLEFSFNSNGGLQTQLLN